MTLVKRIALVTFKVLLGLAILIALLIGVLYWKVSSVEVNYEQFTVLESGDGAHILTIKTANSVLPYGPHYVAITVARASGEEVIIEKQTRLSNDGARIDQNNISSRWIDSGTVSICIRGDEQKDAEIMINVQTRVVSERQKEC